jgi:predicted lipid carrier protein YhbT
LFFQRRLVIEGDTELGLRLKNLLDSVEWRVKIDYLSKRFKSRPWRQSKPQI